MMDIIQHLIDNHDILYYLIAATSFLLELTVMGLGGPLLFFAIASLITGLLVSFGAISGWEWEALALGVITAITALLLWKPLKRFQNSGGGSDTSSDMIGKRVAVSQTITAYEGSIRYSGLNWQSRLASGNTIESIKSGEMCEIVGVDGNIMLVKPLLFQSTRTTD
jgi:inner membrane protein